MAYRTLLPLLDPGKSIRAVVVQSPEQILKGMLWDIGEPFICLLVLFFGKPKKVIISHVSDCAGISAEEEKKKKKKKKKHRHLHIIDDRTTQCRRPSSHLAWLNQRINCHAYLGICQTEKEKNWGRL